jgi:hypothetical protein
MKVYTGERRDSMKYDVMSGASIYRTGMESTLSEHHQQNAKNFDVKFERRQLIQSSRDFDDVIANIIGVI